MSTEAFQIQPSSHRSRFRFMTEAGSTNAKWALFEMEENLRKVGWTTPELIPATWGLAAWLYPLPGEVGFGTSWNPASAYLDSWTYTCSVQRADGGPIFHYFAYNPLTQVPVQFAENCVWFATCGSNIYLTLVSLCKDIKWFSWWDYRIYENAGTWFVDFTSQIPGPISNFLYTAHSGRYGTVSGPLYGGYVSYSNPDEGRTRIGIKYVASAHYGWDITPRFYPDRDDVETYVEGAKQQYMFKPKHNILVSNNEIHMWPDKDYMGYYFWPSSEGFLYEWAMQTNYYFRAPCVNAPTLSGVNPKPLCCLQSINGQGMDTLYPGACNFIRVGDYQYSGGYWGQNNIFDLYMRRFPTTTSDHSDSPFSMVTPAKTPLVQSAYLYANRSDSVKGGIIGVLNDAVITTQFMSIGDEMAWNNRKWVCVAHNAGTWSGMGWKPWDSLCLGYVDEGDGPPTGVLVISGQVPHVSGDAPPAPDSYLVPQVGVSGQVPTVIIS